MFLLVICFCFACSKISLCSIVRMGFGWGYKLSLRSKNGVRAGGRSLYIASRREMTSFFLRDQDGLGRAGEVYTSLHVVK